MPAELPDLGIGDYTVTPLSTKTEQVTEAEALGAGPPLHPPRPLLIELVCCQRVHERERERERTGDRGSEQRRR